MTLYAGGSNILLLLITSYIIFMDKTKRTTNVHPISMLLYGLAGSGKSILASTFPNPLIFDIDNGHKLYQQKNLFPDAKYVRGDNLISLLSEAMKQIREGTFKYKTIVIDSLSNLENLAISRFKGVTSENWSNNLYTSKGKQMGYTEWGNISGSSIAILTELRRYHINVVIITQVSRYSDGGIEKMKPELVGRGSDEALHYPDFVVFLENQTDARIAHLRSSQDDHFVAKARVANDKVKSIRNPHYNDFIELAVNTKPQLDFSK